DALGVIAIMTEHAAIAAMVGQRDGTVDAFETIATASAGDEARKAAPVEEQHGLLAFFESCGDGFEKTPRKDGLFAGLQKLVSHVDQLDLSHRALLDAVGKLQ